MGKTYYWVKLHRFGDRWAGISWLLRQSIKTNTISVVVLTLGLEKHQKFIEILKQLRTKGRIEFIDQNDPQLQGITLNAIPSDRASCIFTAKYCKTNVQWKPGKYKRICYQFDASWRKNERNPPPGDIKKLTTFLPGYEFIKLGLPMSVRQIVDRKSVV